MSVLRAQVAHIDDAMEELVSMHLTKRFLNDTLTILHSANSTLPAGIDSSYQERIFSGQKYPRSVAFSGSGSKN